MNRLPQTTQAEFFGPRLAITTDVAAEGCAHPTKGVANVRAELVKHKPPPYGAATGMVYAYEAAFDWFSLDPNSPYRGWEGTKKIAGELFDDYNDDGGIDIASATTENGGQLRVSFEPALPRVQVTQDSVIVTTKVPVPGGSLVSRHAEARQND